MPGQHSLLPLPLLTRSEIDRLTKELANFRDENVMLNDVLAVEALGICPNCAVVLRTH
jgi:hypothetical protein